MLKQTLLYTGKAKSVYETDSADHLILVFRDDASAFNGEKIEQLDRKGKVNNRFNAFIMEKLLQLVLKLILKNFFLQLKF
jgi:phosphoribosylaminoimidazole-succinocarboxamide synthase